MATIYNFSAGPATLPTSVMARAQADFIDHHGLCYGIVEASHRSPEFGAIIQRAETNIRNLTGIGDEFAVLFLQGGASTQFAMVPMNFLAPGCTAAYVDSGSWSTKAIKEANNLGSTTTVASSKASNYDRIPAFEAADIDTATPYLHITSNNTIFGTQYQTVPDVPAGVPLVADMSSDILSRRLPFDAFDLIYAGAQKNLGPSGVTVIIIRRELAERGASSLPSMLDYRTHIKAESRYNTPPTFAIYMLMLVTNWILDQGGVDAVEQVNRQKAAALYACIDADDFYRGTAEPGSRSIMNVCYRLSTEAKEADFGTVAKAAGFVGLKGHRSAGGMRASIYNAMPLSGVTALVDFMNDYRQRQG
jgi:phosphoserine aminotransferase